MSAGQDPWGALPERAFSDDRLTAIDYRVLGVIAAHDRFGRNGMGCTLNARKLAEKAKVNPAHLARHTKRLEEFGYITIERSNADKRRLIYSVIYDVAAEIVTTDGDQSAEIVTTAKSQVVENIDKPPLNISCKTELRDPAKRGEASRQNRGTGGPLLAHQRKLDRSTVPKQRELRVFGIVNQQNENQKRLAAEQRLGNDLVKAQLIGPLEHWAGTEKGQALVDTREYQKAIECEITRYGNGVKYLLGIGLNYFCPSCRGPHSVNSASSYHNGSSI
ncbi:MAG: MarR family transcriptional regulator [Pseudomonadota bacterium]